MFLMKIHINSIKVNVLENKYSNLQLTCFLFLNDMLVGEVYSIVRYNIEFIVNLLLLFWSAPKLKKKHGHITNTIINKTTVPEAI